MNGNQRKGKQSELIIESNQMPIMIVSRVNV